MIETLKYLPKMAKKVEAKVISITNPAEDYYVIKLSKEPDFKWKAGEHAIFRLPEKEIEGDKQRVFSIASVPREGYILLGTRTGPNPSSFKKALLSMEPGETVTFNGPFGGFRIKDNTTPMVLYASGVGITPIRSILTELESNKRHAIEVVYASNGYYLFEEDLEWLSMGNPRMHIHKTRGIEETQGKLKEFATLYGNMAYYYISGSPAVIDSVTKLYKDMGVFNDRIISDNMKGY